MRIAVILVTACLAAALQGCGRDRGERGGGPRGGFGPGGGSGGPGMMAPQAESREMQLRRFDADADGSITKLEFDKVLAIDFAGADKTNDGALDPAETRALNERLLTQREISPVIDWNADGHVTPEEFGAQWRTLFVRADADGDGTVTAEELAARARPAGRPGGGGRAGGGPPGERRRGGGRSGGP